MSIIVINPPYFKRPAPKTYDVGYLNQEFANVQRGIPSQKVRTFTATSTAFTDVPDSTDHVILYDATAHAITVSLPQPAQAKGLELTLKKIDASAGVVTLVGTLDGAVNPTLATRYKSKTIVSDGITYYVLATV